MSTFVDMERVGLQIAKIGESARVLWPIRRSGQSPNGRFARRVRGQDCEFTATRESSIVTVDFAQPDRAGCADLGAYFSPGNRH